MTTFIINKPLRILAACVMLSTLFYQSLHSQRHSFVEAIFEDECFLDSLANNSSSIVSPDGAFLYAISDARNALLIFERNTNDGTLTFIENISKFDEGIDLFEPRKMIFSPDGHQLYLSAETRLYVFDRNLLNGKLVVRQRLEQDLNGVTGIDNAQFMALSQDGTHLYVSSSLENSITLFDRNTSNGTLSFNQIYANGENGIQGIEGIVNLALSPDEKHLYAIGTSSDALVVFDRDQTDGSLAFIEILEDGVNGINGLYEPRGISISHDGKQVYVASAEDDAIAVFDRDQTNGTLNFSQVLIDGVDGVDGLNRAFDVKVSHDGIYVYAVGSFEHSFSIFHRDTTSGLLTFDQIIRDADHDGLRGGYNIATDPTGQHFYISSYFEPAIALIAREKPILSLTFTEEGIRDHSGRKNHGWSKHPLTTVEGDCRQGIDIGQNAVDAVFIPGQSIDGLEDFTISIRAKINDQNNSNNLLSCANTTVSNELIIGYNEFLTDKGFHLVIQNVFYHFPNSETILPDLEWHDIVVTRKADSARLYIDRNLISGPIPVSTAVIDVAPGGFVLGQDQDNLGGGFQSSQSWHGSISSVNIYQYALEASEVRSIYCFPCPGYGTPCDDGDPNTIDDMEDGSCNCTGVAVANSTVSMHFDGNLTNTSSPEFSGCSLFGPTYVSSNCGQEYIFGKNDTSAVFLPGHLIDQLGDFTISFNAELTGINPTNTIFSAANFDQINEFTIEYVALEGIRMAIWDNTYTYPGSANILDDLDPHHIVITRDGHESRLYVDGNLIGASPTIVSDKVLKVVTGGFVIGQRQSLVGGGFDASTSMWGILDQFRIFPFVITEDRIHQLDCSFCPLISTANDDPIMDDAVYAEQSIFSSGHIEATDAILFQAKESIEFNMDFNIDAGAELNVQIDDCPINQIIDIDNNSYTTVKIGNQEWMSENLRTTKYNDGTPIPNAINGEIWANSTTGAYNYYEHNPNYNTPYGKLYNWYTVDSLSNGNKNVCPVGWHVPSDQEFSDLIDFLVLQQAGLRLKETGTIEAGTGIWHAPNPSSNEFRFNGVPGGSRSGGSSGLFSNLGYNGNFWTRTLLPSNNTWAIYYRLNYNNRQLEPRHLVKTGGFSVRCLKD